MGQARQGRSCPLLPEPCMPRPLRHRSLEAPDVLGNILHQSAAQRVCSIELWISSSAGHKKDKKQEEKCQNRETNPCRLRLSGATPQRLQRPPRQRRPRWNPICRRGLAKRHICAHPYHDTTDTTMRRNRQSPAAWHGISESLPHLSPRSRHTQSPLRVPSSADHGPLLQPASSAGWLGLPRVVNGLTTEPTLSSIRRPLIVLQRVVHAHPMGPECPRP